MNEQIYVRGWAPHHWILKMWPCHRCARIVLRGSVRRDVWSLNWVPCPCCSVSTDMTLLVPNAPVTIGSYWPVTHWLIKMLKMVTRVHIRYMPFYRLYIGSYLHHKHCVALKYSVVRLKDWCCEVRCFEIAAIAKLAELKLRLLPMELAQHATCLEFTAVACLYTIRSQTDQ